MRCYLIVLFICFHQLLHGQVITNYASGSAIYDPNGLIFDVHDNLYVSSPGNHTIVKIDTSGIVTIIAGTGSPGFSGDGGPATNAKLNEPIGIAVDSSGNIFFADNQNQRVRKIDAVTGIISTIVGTGPGGVSTGGYSGDGGLASAAQLNAPSSICFDNLGNLYISDLQNYRIRKVNLFGIISTVAGNGVLGDSGDGGLAIAAKIFPTCICIDNSRNLYLSNFGAGTSGNNVRKIDTFGIISTIAGDSTSCSYNGDGIDATTAQLGVYYLSINNGALYLSDYCNNRIRKIDNLGFIHTVAGNGIMGNTGNGGPADSAEIDHPYGIAFDHCGNLYIAQVNNPCIRKVTFNSACTPLLTSEIATTEITIYPNPATSELHIDGVKAQTNYSLINVIGIIEQSGTLKPGNNSINIQSLPPGMYLLQLTDNEGGKTMRKIVKE